jgi:hypothetical protein
MDTAKCQDCEQLFWMSEPGQCVCNECSERENTEANRERCVEQEVAYITTRRSYKGK